MPWDKKRLKGEWEDRAKRSRYRETVLIYLSRERDVFFPPFPSLIALIFHQVHGYYLFFFYASVEIEFCV